MELRLDGFIKKALWVVLLFFVLRYLISPPTSVYDFFGVSAEAITITIIVMSLYEKWLWKYNPLEKIPKLGKKYKGRIMYCFNGKDSEKDVVLKIQQTLLKVSIKIITDEVHSNSISSSFVLENNEYVLYYTYLTNPKSKVSKDNPIQYGTCRLMIVENNNLQGIYWTSRQTIGDLYLIKLAEIIHL